MNTQLNDLNKKVSILYFLSAIFLVIFIISSVLENTNITGQWIGGIGLVISLVISYIINLEKKKNNIFK